MSHYCPKFFKPSKKFDKKFLFKLLVIICLAMFFLFTALIYAMPLSGSDDEPTEASTFTDVFKNFFQLSKSAENSTGFRITDPFGSTTDPETALSNQFRFANQDKLLFLAPGDKLDFGYEISNPGKEAIDIRETYYILTFGPQDGNALDFAIFGGFTSPKVNDFFTGYMGDAPLTPNKLDSAGRLYSFSSDIYTLSGSNETINGAPNKLKRERYMVFNCFAGNDVQDETIVVVTTLGYKLHSEDEWQPSITETVKVGGVTEYTEYRTDTDVYFSCDIAALDYINPDNPGYVYFTVTDQTGAQTTLTYSDFSSPVIGVQRAYVPFHIPNVTGDLTVTITSSDNVICDTNEIIATVVSSEENTPPDPSLDMSIAVGRVLPAFSESKRHEWNTYSSWKNESGEWVYEEHIYSAILTNTFKLTPDSNAKTAVGSTLRSGYGVNAEIKSVISANDSVFPVQNVYCTFPEFDYEDYSRKLEIVSEDALTNTWQFRVNPYSHSNSRAHYIPPAYPDGLYTVQAIVRDAWTPIGELKGSVIAEVNIIGSLYDDWYITQSE